MRVEEMTTKDCKEWLKEHGWSWKTIPYNGRRPGEVHSIYPTIILNQAARRQTCAFDLGCRGRIGTLEWQSAVIIAKEVQDAHNG